MQVTNFKLQVDRRAGCKATGSRKIRNIRARPQDANEVGEEQGVKYQVAKLQESSFPSHRLHGNRQPEGVHQDT